MHILTHRQLQVACLLAYGSTSQTIADVLMISINTVTQHIYAIYNATGMGNRIELARWYRANQKG